MHLTKLAFDAMLNPHTHAASLYQYKWQLAIYALVLPFDHELTALRLYILTKSIHYKLGL